MLGSLIVGRWDALEALQGLHHDHPFTVRTDPGRAVTDTPFILLEAVLADLKATGATPTKFLFFFAAMAAVFTKAATAITLLLSRCISHLTSLSSQLR
jgi:hypothetical protein